MLYMKQVEVFIINWYLFKPSPALGTIMFLVVKFEQDAITRAHCRKAGTRGHIYF